MNYHSELSEIDAFNKFMDRAKKQGIPFIVCPNCFREIPFGNVICPICKGTIYKHEMEQNDEQID